MKTVILPAPSIVTRISGDQPAIAIEQKIQKSVIEHSPIKSEVVVHPIQTKIAMVGPRGPAGIDGPQGPQGPEGPEGPRGGDAGQIRYTGVGPPPDVILGAHPGDTYMDLSNGNVYKLV